MIDYETFSTTADVGIRIRGQGYEGLFVNALKGLNLLLFGDKAADISAQNASPYAFEYQGDGCENILVNLLSEVLFLLQSRGELTADIRIITASETKIKVELMVVEAGLTADLEIKSVTYHNLKVVDKNGVKCAEVVFDI